MILGLSVAYAATYCFSLVFLADFSVETDGWQGWRAEATFGTMTNRYRRLTRNLEQDTKAAEDAVELANFTAYFDPIREVYLRRHSKTGSKALIESTSTYLRQIYPNADTV